MKLHQLKSITKNKRANRPGRGIAGFGGKTAGRGTKGQKARTGYKIPRRFEGGQVSLIQRLPKKRGVKNLRRSTEAVRADFMLKHFKSGEEINPTKLFAKGLISNPKLKIKIIGCTDNKKLAIDLRNYKFSNCKFSESIQKMIEVKPVIKSNMSKEKADDLNR